MSVQEQEQVVWLSVSTPSITLAPALALAQVLALHPALDQGQGLDQTRATAAVATLAPMSGTPSQDHRSSRKSSSHLAMLQHYTILSHCICFGGLYPLGCMHFFCITTMLKMGCIVCLCLHA